MDFAAHFVNDSLKMSAIFANIFCVLASLLSVIQDLADYHHADI